ncbi:MAG: radical SAM protein [FCB group bacterium]|jgi:MoaA/NifB/PqqE/SkfB family radical SAM enzyme|nr:radical SAM protein [FCB group bacterium]
MAMIEQAGSSPALGERPSRAVVKTKKRTLSKRGVMWLGQTCNLRCYFCYFLNRVANAHHPEHPFMDLPKVKAMCKTMREFYGNTSIDIQGGEPTIYPDILELIRYCNEIGLVPTLITNGLQLAKPGVLEEFRDAGIRDFLVSYHGIGEVHDEVVCKKGSYEKMDQAVRRMRELGVPFRFNCTLSKPVVPLLTEVAQKAIEYGALAVNYIAFNPFEDQETGIRTHEKVSQYSAIMEELTKAMDMLEAAGIEVNVRYMPICMAEPRHRKNFYNFQQLSYDHHEWDYQSWLWTGMTTQRMQEGGLSPVFRLGTYARRFCCGDSKARLAAYERSPLWGRLRYGIQHLAALVEQRLRGQETLYREEAINRARDDAKYRYHEACGRCAARQICDGFHGDYANLFGTDEARPLTDIPPTTDPCRFIREQDKVVEEEDKSWAM